ncbi:MAG: hypothetical protein ABIN36_09725 [Ferruginibacter sp.]
MPNNFPRSPKLVKGSLVEIRHEMNGYKQNVIVFQYNPETMTRKLEAWFMGGSGGNGSGADTTETAQPFDPVETFDLALELDAADQLENPAANPTIVKRGVAERIAALELLLYPQDDQKAAGLSTPAENSVASDGKGGSNSGKISSTSKPVPRGTVPDLLFCWGDGRIVPVRLTSFSVEEQAYSPTLYPIRAKVTVGLKILTPRNIPCSKKQSSELVITAYKNYTEQKKVMAASYLITNKDDPKIV